MGPESLYVKDPAASRFVAGGMAEAESLLGRDDDREPPADPEEVMRLFEELVWRRAHLDPSFVIPRCANARCRCMWHHERTEGELEVTRELARRKEEGS